MPVWLIRSVNTLQIYHVLAVIGARGRTVISSMFPRLESGTSPTEAEPLVDLGPATQAVTYSGPPRSIARYDLQTLLHLAQKADAVIAIECGVGSAAGNSTRVTRRIRAAPFVWSFRCRIGRTIWPCHLTRYVSSARFMYR
jgi:hypothetical protein